MHDDLMTDLVRQYTARTPASGEYSAQLRRHLPGGETRSVTYFEPYPIMLAEGHGARVSDVDGNEYTDALNNYTALVHGHGFGPAADAAIAAIPCGTVFPAPHPAQLRLASLLTGRYPAVDLVRFTNSGTEAALLALRIARRATGRIKVLMFSGGYHGSVPELVDRGPDTITVPYNDADQAADQIDDSVAAVFAEPFLGSSGVIPAAPGFLRQVADLCRAAGSVFVLDEVQALRNAPRGIHAELGLTPDLVVMGKLIGGGFPVGAIGGRRDLMELTSAARPGSLPGSGTFNGNVITMVAGAASLTALDAAAIMTLNGRAASLADRIEAAARRAGMPVSVTRAGSILHVHLLAEPPVNAEQARVVPAGWQAALHLALLLEGVYTAPRGMLNLSTAMNGADLDVLHAGYQTAFQRIRDLASAGPVPASRI
jgi:glutamate-1-semialdehyde 2,1-aminomutase